MPLTREQLVTLPKAELHVHLRGAVPLEVLAEQMSRYSAEDVWDTVPLRLRGLLRRCANLRAFFEKRRWTATELPPLFSYSSFRGFLLTYYFTGLFFRRGDDLRRLIAGVLNGLAAQGIVYAEITISVPEYLQRGITLSEIGDCLSGAAEGSEVRVQWIVDLVRDYGRDACLSLLGELLDLGCQQVVGITLGGSEDRHPPAAFGKVYDLARDNGLRLSVHAGEALGPESVWDALRILRAERLGHGVRAIEDPELVAHLAAERTPLEVCPTSNLRTGLYSTYEEHPAQRLHNEGAVVTVNSDDPTFFRTSLVDEYLSLQRAGMTEADLLSLLRNGFQSAFLVDTEARGYLDALEEALTRVVGS